MILARLAGAQRGLLLKDVEGNVQFINVCVSSLHQQKSGRLLSPVTSVFSDREILIGFLLMLVNPHVASAFLLSSRASEIPSKFLEGNCLKRGWGL